jgi:hypothetical protein
LVKYGEVLAFGSGGQSGVGVGVGRLVLILILMLMLMLVLVLVPGRVAMGEMEGTNMDV